MEVGSRGGAVRQRTCAPWLTTLTLQGEGGQAGSLGQGNSTLVHPGQLNVKPLSNSYCCPFQLSFKKVFKCINAFPTTGFKK